MNDLINVTALIKFLQRWGLGEFLPNEERGIRGGRGQLKLTKLGNAPIYNADKTTSQFPTEHEITS